MKNLIVAMMACVAVFGLTACEGGKGKGKAPVTVSG